ncbi:MAG: YbaB/EbfC family nucleoid-associated protein [Ruminococcaceae bacterium]|nr:YbaB/EbfC family nucleoid-associated protein [Oscillospiraceae bacterium]
MKARLPQGMGGGPSNMQAMLKQAQKMQEDMANLQTELEQTEYEVKAGGGAVTIKMNGKKEVTSLEISPDIVDPDDIETLCDVITAAVNEAVKRVESDASEKMGQITGGMGNLGLPGLF